MKKKFSSLLVLAAGDFLTVLVCFLLAHLFRTQVLQLFYVPRYEAVPLTNYLEKSHLFVVWLAVFAYEKLYTKRFAFWDEVRAVLKSTTIAFSLIMILIFATQQYTRYSRLVIVLAWLLSLLLFPASRVLAKTLLIRLGLWSKKVIIIGAGAAVTPLIEAIENNRILGYEIVGVLAVDRADVGQSIRGVKILGEIDDLERIKPEAGFDDIIVRLPDLTGDRMVALMKRWESGNETIRYIPRTGDLISSGVEIENIGRLLSLTVRKNLARPWNMLVKNVVEFVTAMLMLMALTPVFLALAVVIKLESRGPVFFIQERYGKRGKKIRLIKFRTMVADADHRLAKHLQENPEAQEEWTRFKKLKDGDPRVTPSGRFLRRHSLDELPQLINVLKGDMSLVGPRPYIMEELMEVEDIRSILLQVKPGITGLWQVSGRSAIPFEERLAMEEYYLRNWSLWQDFVIIMRTVKVLATGQGAY